MSMIPPNLFAGLQQQPQGPTPPQTPPITAATTATPSGEPRDYFTALGVDNGMPKADTEGHDAMIERAKKHIENAHQMYLDESARGPIDPERKAKLTGQIALGSLLAAALGNNRYNNSGNEAGNATMQYLMGQQQDTNHDAYQKALGAFNATRENNLAKSHWEEEQGAQDMQGANDIDLNDKQNAANYVKNFGLAATLSEKDRQSKEKADKERGDNFAKQMAIYQRGYSASKNPDQRKFWLGLQRKLFLEDPSGAARSGADMSGVIQSFDQDAADKAATAEVPQEALQKANANKSDAQKGLIGQQILLTGAKANNLTNPNSLPNQKIQEQINQIKENKDLVKQKDIMLKNQIAHLPEKWKEDLRKTDAMVDREEAAARKSDASGGKGGGGMDAKTMNAKLRMVNAGEAAAQRAVGQTEAAMKAYRSTHPNTINKSDQEIIDMNKPQKDPKTGKMTPGDAKFEHLKDQLQGYKAVIGRYQYSRGRLETAYGIDAGSQVTDNSKPASVNPLGGPMGMAQIIMGQANKAIKDSKNKPVHKPVKPPKDKKDTHWG